MIREVKNFKKNNKMIWKQNRVKCNPALWMKLIFLFNLETYNHKLEKKSIINVYHKIHHKADED